MDFSTLTAGLVHDIMVKHADEYAESGETRISLEEYENRQFCKDIINGVTVREELDKDDYKVEFDGKAFVMTKAV